MQIKNIRSQGAHGERVVKGLDRSADGLGHGRLEARLRRWRDREPALAGAGRPEPGERRGAARSDSTTGLGPRGRPHGQASARPRPGHGGGHDDGHGHGHGRSPRPRPRPQPARSGRRTTATARRPGRSPHRARDPAARVELAVVRDVTCSL